MNRLNSLMHRVAILESRIFVLEGTEDKERLRRYLGDDLYEAYMNIRNRIPSEYDLIRQYPEYSLAMLDNDDSVFKDFSKKYNKLRKSNLITGVGSSMWGRLPEAADIDDLYNSYNNYNDMRDYVINTFNSLRSFDELKNLDIGFIKKFVNSYKSVGDTVAKAKEGADLIYSDSKWDVYKVRTYAASKYYGKDTRWCISGNYEGHESRGEFYFNDYISSKNLDGGFYFYISKTNPREKYCLLQNKDGNVHSIWDARDNSLDIGYEVEDIGLPKVKGINLHDYRIDTLTSLVGNEDIEGVREFLKHHEPDLNLNSLDAVGDCAIELAASVGNVQILKVLLDAGLDPNIENRKGFFALLDAICDKEYDIAKLLLDYGADPNKVSSHYNKSLLYIAIENAPIKYAELLLEYNADTEISDSKNRTPLFMAARYGDIEKVKLLVKYDANINAQAMNGTTPLDQAIKNRHEDVVEYLKSIGAMQNTTA